MSATDNEAPSCTVFPGVIRKLLQTGSSVFVHGKSFVGSRMALPMRCNHACLLLTRGCTLFLDGLTPRYHFPFALSQCGWTYRDTLLAACGACTASGTAMAAPPISRMNSRCFTGPMEQAIRWRAHQVSTLIALAMLHRNSGRDVEVWIGQTRLARANTPRRIGCHRTPDAVHDTHSPKRPLRAR